MIKNIAPLLSGFFSVNRLTVQRFIAVYSSIVEYLIKNKTRYYDEYASNDIDYNRKWNLVEGVEINVVMSNNMDNLAGITSNQNIGNLKIMLVLRYDFLCIADDDIRFILAHELGHLISNKGTAGDCPDIDDNLIFEYLDGEASADFVAMLLTDTTFDGYLDITNRLRESKTGVPRSMLQSMVYSKMKCFDNI